MAVSEDAHCQQEQGHRVLVCLLFFPMLVLLSAGAAGTNKSEWHTFKWMKNAGTIDLCKHGAIGKC